MNSKCAGDIYVFSLLSLYFHIFDAVRHKYMQKYSKTTVLGFFPPELWYKFLLGFFLVLVHSAIGGNVERKEKNRRIVIHSVFILLFAPIIIMIFHSSQNWKKKMWYQGSPGKIGKQISLVNSWKKNSKHTQKIPVIKATLIHTHFFLSDCDETLHEQQNNSLKRTPKSESMIVRLFESELSIQCSTTNEYENEYFICCDFNSDVYLFSLFNVQCVWCCSVCCY